MIFIDTNVFAYAEEETASETTSLCRLLLSGVAENRVAARTSASVVEEIWHLQLRGRPRLKPRTAEKALTLFAPVLPVTHAIVEQALALDVKALGSNDRIHVATCRAAGIDTIVTADAAFDEVEGLRRVDPGERAAMEALLAA